MSVFLHSLQPINPTWISDWFQGLGDKMSNAGNSRCSTPASGVLSDEGSPPSGKADIAVILKNRLF